MPRRVYFNGVMSDTHALRTHIRTWLADVDSAIDSSALSARFWRLTELEGSQCPISCLQWTGSRTTDGYGRFTIKGQSQRAHRVALRIGLGHIAPRAIPDGFTVDHVRELGCKGYLCVNPAHLEAVPNSVNARRQRNLEVFT